MAVPMRPTGLEKFYTQRPNRGGSPTVAVQNSDPNPAPQMVSMEQAKGGLDKFYNNSPRAGQQVPNRF